MRVLALFITSFVLVVVGNYMFQSEIAFTKIIMCDVGQGDALLVQRQSTQIVIDFGYGNEVVGCLRKHMPWWDRKIELVVATHADADHIGGFDDVAAAYQLENVWITHQKPENKQLSEFASGMEKVSKSGAQTKVPKQGDSFKVDVFELDVVWPEAKKGPNGQTETILSAFDNSFFEEVEDKNTGSIALYIRFEEVCMLVTGDIDTVVETALQKSALITKCQLLKVAHHGSKTASQQSFITKLRPEYGLIGVGENNSYGHPDASVMSRLKAVNTRVLRTDTDGEIVLLTDGESIWEPE